MSGGGERLPTAHVSAPEPEREASMAEMVDGEMAPPLMQLETLLALGLDQRMAENALVNGKVTTNLASFITEALPAVTGQESVALLHNPAAASRRHRLLALDPEQIWELHQGLARPKERAASAGASAGSGSGFASCDWFVSSEGGDFSGGCSPHEDGREEGRGGNGEGGPLPCHHAVLAVDDDPVCLKVLETLLRRCQYDGHNRGYEEDMLKQHHWRLRRRAPRHREDVAPE